MIESLSTNEDLVGHKGVVTTDCSEIVNDNCTHCLSCQPKPSPAKPDMKSQSLVPLQVSEELVGLHLCVCLSFGHDCAGLKKEHLIS